MIRKANEINAINKKLRVLIAGTPGVGKTTVALSAPKPLLIDCDFGIDRVEPAHRHDYIQPQTYNELLEDLKPNVVSDYETLCFDTGGKLLDLMKIWAIKCDPKNGKRDGGLQIQGYGVVAREFQRLMDYCYYELNKNIVVIFHSVEDKDGDNTRLRLMIEGQTKNTVWIPMDIGGFVEMIGNDRTIGFSPCERYYAKGTRGIKGEIKIPELTKGKPNDFLTKIFESYNKRNAEEVGELAKMTEEYNDAMQSGLAIISQVENAETANAMIEPMSQIKHALTSKTELSEAWSKKIAGLNLIYDKGSKEYKEA